MTGVMFVVYIPTAAHENYLKQCNKNQHVSVNNVTSTNSVVDVEPVHSTMMKDGDHAELLEHEEVNGSWEKWKNTKEQNHLQKESYMENDEVITMEKVR